MFRPVQEQHGDPTGLASQPKKSLRPGRCFQEVLCLGMIGLCAAQKCVAAVTMRIVPKQQCVPGEFEGIIKKKKVETDSVTMLQHIWMTNRRVELSRALTRTDLDTREGKQKHHWSRAGSCFSISCTCTSWMGEYFTKDVFL